MGDIQDSCEFPAVLKVAESSVRDLLAQSRAARAAARIATRASGDEELDREVIRVTKEEVSKGWMRGLFTEEQLNEKYGLWTAARRFGLRQGGAAGKVRPVDDFSEYGQNGTLTTPFKVDLGGVDGVAALARSLHSSARVGKVQVRDEDGEERLGCLHPEWKGSPGPIKGATADLAQAFRQLARLPAHARFSIVSVFNPEKGQEFYELDAMAFGQGAAVYGFNRVARGVEAIMVKVGIVCCDYVDDYPIVEPELTVDSAIVAFVSFAQLFGWKVKNPL